MLSGLQERRGEGERVSDDFEEYVAARARLRARRTSRAAVLAAAVLVAGVPLGLAALRGGSVPRQGPAARPSATPVPVSGYLAAPDGWRWETGNGLQALVPDSWGYGVDLDSPCNRQVGPGVPGAVEVPGTHTLVGCPGPEPRSNYLSFLRFGRLDQKAPTGNGRWVTEEVRFGGRVATVRSDHPAVLHRILRSVSVVRGTDHNGCPLHHPAFTDHAWRPTPVQGAVDGVPDVVSVCRYGSLDRPRDRGLLSFSTVLTSAHGEATMADLRSEPPGSGPNRPAQCVADAQWGDSVAVLRARFAAGWQEYVVRFDGCDHHGTDDGRTRRALTRVVARAVLVGYRGGLNGPVFGLTGNWLRDNNR